jgi:hypothetical protein
MTETQNLESLREAFRSAVRSGQSGAAEYAAWVLSHGEQTAAVAIRNRDGGGRVTAANNKAAAERAFLVPEGTCLQSNRELIGRSVGANVGGQPVIYTAETHNERVRVWRERLTAYLGYDCSAVEPSSAHTTVPYVEPLTFNAEPTPGPAPREYGVELSAAVTEDK